MSSTPLLEREQLIARTLHHMSVLFRGVHSNQHQAWLTCELTMPQLKALVRVAQHEGATSGQIARGLGVTLSTVTGIVDRLAEQHLVTRREDAHDRRITRVELTPSGREMVEQLLRYRDQHFTLLLEHLDDEQLQTVERAIEYLAQAATRMADSEPLAEVVA
jgi:DNA-binding MarR family transcriptional regulator